MSNTDEEARQKTLQGLAETAQAHDNFQRAQAEQRQVEADKARKEEQDKNNNN